MAAAAAGLVNNGFGRPTARGCRRLTRTRAAGAAALAARSGDTGGIAPPELAMGLPSAAVQTSYLASPTVNTIVYNSLHSSGSSIFGAGVLGANYTSGTGSYVAVLYIPAEHRRPL